MFKPGQSGNPNGRKKGSHNKATKLVKEAFAQLLENNLDHMTGWLAQIAADSPKDAMELMLKMSERFVPKLAQQQLTDGNGEDLFKNVQFKFGEPTEYVEDNIKELDE